MTFARIRALIFVAVLFVTAGVVVIMAITRDTQTQPIHVNACPSGLVPAKVKMPERNEVTINVYNGTKIVGLAQKVGAEFANRGFHVDKMATAPGNKIYDEIALITYGPDAVGAGWLVSAYFLVDQATMDFQLKRKGAQVDVIIGTRFQQLATTTEVNQSIAALGNPDLPPGTCAG
jgi:LytR cell envelope-related transcriptional attenuator